jgi:hypothetical protein
MGSAIGCCGKQEDDPNNVTTNHNLNKDFHSSDKLRRIVAIQSVFRGFLARKRVKAIKESGSGMKSMMHHFNFNGPANYDN